MDSSSKVVNLITDKMEVKCPTYTYSRFDQYLIDLEFFDKILYVEFKNENF